MIEISHLLILADAFKHATGLEDVTVSHRLFKDSKKLTALRIGAGITIDRFNDAFVWFSENWPEGTEWPEGVMRPASERAA